MRTVLSTLQPKYITYLTYRVDKHNPLSYMRCSQQNSEEHLPFEASNNAEFSQLLDQGVFDVVPSSKRKGYRIYGSRFVDKLKSVGLPTAFKKSHLVIQGLADKFHRLLIYTPTALRALQRVLLCFAAIFLAPKMFTRDKLQAST